MNWFRQAVFLLPLALFGCTTAPDSPASEVGDAPPVALMQENCRKAEVIIQGLVLAQRAGDSSRYSAATLSIEKVYKGTFHATDTIQYSFFKEENHEPFLLGKRLIFFLKPYRANGNTLWVRASDLPVFSSNAATEKLLYQTLN